MKIRWTGEPRALADPQIEVSKGDVVDVDEKAARSLIKQELAEPVTPSKPKRKPKTTEAPDASVEEKD